MELEEELRKPINEWITGLGLRPVNEYRICWRIPDVIGLGEKRIEVAVEMKLADWKRALWQAKMYTMFAIRSYVAMPSSRQGLMLRNIREFRRKGVGALSVREDGTVRKLIESDVHQGAFSHAIPSHSSEESMNGL